MATELSGPFGSTAGSFGFGHGAVADPRASPNATKPPAALFFDPATKDFKMDAEGRFVTVDPVDQEVVLALWVRKGSIASAPDVGCDFRNLKRQGGRDYQAKVEDAVRQALKRPLSRGAIRLVSVTVQTPIRGTTFLQVTYVNLTLASPGSSQTQTVVV